MRLYHGTSFAAFEKIREEGIRPRCEVGTNNWAHTVSGNPNCVYLTDAYPLHHLLNASKVTKGAVIEVDTNQLDERLLVPDHACLAMAEYAKGESKRSLAELTEVYRDELEKFIGTDLWKATLKYSASCGFLGTIPVEALTKAVIVDVTKNLHLLIQLEPTISILSHRIKGSYYKSLIAWMFGNQPEPEIPNDRVEIIDAEYIVLSPPGINTEISERQQERIVW